MEILIPTTVREAVELHKKNSPSHFLAGGTLVNSRRWKKKGSLVSLSALGLTGVEIHGGDIFIGAMTSLSEVEASEKLTEAGLEFLQRSIRDLQRKTIRNAATMGGCVAAHLSYADPVPALYVLDAKLRVQFDTEASHSELGIDEYMALRALDRPLILGLVIKRPGKNSRFGSARRARNAGDIPFAKAVCRLDMDAGACKAARLAVGVSGVPVSRLPEVEKMLVGPTPDVDKAALAAAEAVRPVSDVRGSRSFKRKILGVLVKDALEQALDGGDAR